MNATARRKKSLSHQTPHSSVPSPSEAPPEALATKLSASISTWFKQSQRPLPWRVDYEPYRVWISEVMLQQTQVDTMLPYYARWMARFPTLAALATASEQEVLKAWQGLGYYARARNLHRAAQAVQHEHGGQIPDTLETLRALPGVVGPYTAGAVASIAFNRPVPIVDGNVGRVLGRLFALTHPPRSPRGVALLWQWAAALVPREGARDFNQGMMELGALVCHDKAPSCLLCPVQSDCQALALGNPEAFPPKSARKVRPMRTGVMLVLRLGGTGGPILLRQRPSKGLWGGLWEFPWNEGPLGIAPAECVASCVPESWRDWSSDLVGVAMRPLGQVRHGLTHFELELEAHLAEWHAPAVDLPPLPIGWAWAAPEQMVDYPQARLNQKARALLAKDGATARGKS